MEEIANPPLFQKTSVSDVKLVDLSSFVDKSASLVVFEERTLEGGFERAFFVRASEKTSRGMHAHKECNQWLICIQGKITVLVHDGYSESKIVLEASAQALHIPAGIWSSQVYESDSILLVLADLKFNENDYVRSWQQFLNLKGIQ